MQAKTATFYSLGRAHMYWGRKPLTGLVELFRELQRDQVLLDPFCGAGTSLIAALMQGARVIGCDLNPMAVFLSTIMVRPLNIGDLQSAFGDVTELVGETISAAYRMACPSCRGMSDIEYIVWQGLGDNARPIEAGLTCPKCKGRILHTLTPSQIRTQMAKRRIKPSYWVPDTTIRSTRKPPVEHHRELFTGRNLSMLAELLHAIDSTKNKRARDAMRLMFTSILYSCSEMQMYSEKEPSSSRGWTALRYYVPPRRKEMNVWRAFERRFQGFLRAKRGTNSAIPFVRVTDDPDLFFDGGYEALIRNDNAFRLRSKYLRKADHVFLDPPYNDDIDYFGFSEFWGSWLRMSFDYESEWHPKYLKSEGLKRILRRTHRYTHTSCQVSLVCAPKRAADWDIAHCAESAGYTVDQARSGSFLYDNSQKRGGIDARRESYHWLVRREDSDAVADAPASCLTPSAESVIEDVAPYIRVGAHLYPDYKPERLRSAIMDEDLVPDHLRLCFESMKESEILHACGSENANREAFYTYCYALLNPVLVMDGWRLLCTSRSTLESGAFGIESAGVKEATGRDVLETAILVAEKDKQKLLFHFEDQPTNVLSESCARIASEDEDNFRLIFVLIASGAGSLDRFRKVSAVREWPRAFFSCVTDLRWACNQFAPADYARISGPVAVSDYNEETTPNRRRAAAFYAQVVEQTAVGEEPVKHYKLVIKSDALQNVLPGQFVMIGTRPRETRRKQELVSWGDLKTRLHLGPRAFLLRPFGIHRTFYPGFGPTYLRHLSLPPSLSTVMHTVLPNQFDLFYKVLDSGVGTQEMTSLRKGDKIEMIGPLGRRFNARHLRTSGVEEVHVIGGGMGMAPLVFLVQALRYYSFRVKVFVGIARPDMLKYTETFGEEPRYAYVYIDDLLQAGVPGRDIYLSCESPDPIDLGDLPSDNIRVGLVTTQYQEHVALGPGEDTGPSIMAFACGPVRMMKSIWDITRQVGIPLRVLMEKRMACGIGVCFSCVCRTRDATGSSEYTRVCTDGPLFDAERIVWEEEEEIS